MALGNLPCRSTCSDESAQLRSFHGSHKAVVDTLDLVGGLRDAVDEVNHLLVRDSRKQPSAVRAGR